MVLSDKWDRKVKAWNTRRNTFFCEGKYVEVPFSQPERKIGNLNRTFFFVFMGYNCFYRRHFRRAKEASAHAKTAFSREIWRESCGNLPREISAKCRAALAPRKKEAIRILNLQTRVTDSYTEIGRVFPQPEDAPLIVTSKREEFANSEIFVARSSALEEGWPKRVWARRQDKVSNRKARAQ